MLQSLFNSIDTQSEQLALIEGDRQLSYRQLFQAARETSTYLKKIGSQRVAVILDNSIDWVIIDLACQLSAICFVPLPHFFTPDQIQHAIGLTSIDTIFTHQDAIPVELDYEKLTSPFKNLICIKKYCPIIAAIPTSTTKITFTSGSTGKPKGVCLSTSNQLLVSESLKQSIAIKKPRHLCLLPLSTLLENIAGIYTPLMSGGTVIVADSASRGLSGSSMLNPKLLLKIISSNQPNSLILVPELLLLLVNAAEAGWQVPSSLKFIAVGGSKVSVGLLQRAYKNNLPVFQGYGLSECASVVCLCTPENNKLGTVGKPLPHVNIGIENGEIKVNGNTFLGYVGEPESWYSNNINTGDLGGMDDVGNYSISGRKKNLIISSFGRNICPEWIESECLKNGLLNQCVVFGDAKPWSVTLVSTTNPKASNEDINEWMYQVNQSLPDYAQVKNWLRIPFKFSIEMGLLTENGRPKRQAIEQLYKNELQQLFSTPHYSYQ